MKIKSVQLPPGYRGFTNLRITSIPETARLVVLIGPNGTGKSSLFDAFLLKSQSKHNYTYDSSKREYYQKEGHDGVSVPTTFELRKFIEIEFHSQQPSDDQWAKVFNIRTSYRNESDFRLEGLHRVGPASENLRFERIIDPDQAVSDNYNRLAWKRQSDLDKDAPPDTTFGKYREESLRKLQQAMRFLFPDPALELESFGSMQDSGTFLFSKGKVKSFPYLNLSGGEKAAFDLLLDVFVKRHEYQDAVYCIDEPETHIATAQQGNLLEALLGLVPEESQFWIATHSIGFIRKAFDRMREKGDVAFLDFSRRDFDQEVTITPQEPSRDFWLSTYKIALDDLSQLVAPDRIILCEGNKKRADKGFDADCYNQIFSDTHQDTLFMGLIRETCHG